MFKGHLNINGLWRWHSFIKYRFHLTQPKMIIIYYVSWHHSWVYLAKNKNFKDVKETIAIAKTPGHRKKTEGYRVVAPHSSWYVIAIDLVTDHSRNTGRANPNYQYYAQTTTNFAFNLSSDNTLTLRHRIAKNYCNVSIFCLCHCYISLEH